jgi:hypothetical protein
MLASLCANNILVQDLCAEGPSDAQATLVDDLFATGLKKLVHGRVAAFKSIEFVPEESNGPITPEELFGPVNSEVSPL